MYVFLSIYFTSLHQLKNIRHTILYLLPDMSFAKCQRCLDNVLQECVSVYHRLIFLHKKLNHNFTHLVCHMRTVKISKCKLQHCFS